jgi:hypothetical protein
MQFYYYPEDKGCPTKQKARYRDRVLPLNLFNPGNLRMKSLFSAFK